VRRAVLFALVLVGCGSAEPAPAAPPAPPPPAVPVDDPSFYACAAPTDSVIVPGACGLDVAANVAHAAEVTAIQNDIATRSRCVPPPTSTLTVPLRAECQAGRCAAVPDVMAES
jgi:PBP1b-binding outer membrane lipoprotein LpoB